MRELLSLAVVVFCATQIFAEGYWLLFPVVVMPLAIGFLALSVYERLYIEGQWFRIQPQVPTRLEEDGGDTAGAVGADGVTEQTAVTPVATPASTRTATAAAAKTAAQADAPPPPNVDDFAPVDLGDLDDFFKKK